MNKMLVAAAVVAVGAGGYWYSQQEVEVSASDNDVMAYIPADTPIFSAQLQPFPIKSYINSLSDAYKQSGANSLGEWEDEDEPRAQFFLSLMKSYLAAMKDGDTFVSTFGLADNVRSYFYTLGAMPVLKLEVTNADAIWALLDKAEIDSGLKHVPAQLKGVNYRSYRLTDTNEDEHINLVVAVYDSILTLTLDTSFSEPALLETALAVTPVEHSIVDAKIIEDIIAKHGFTNEGISYINHQEIVKAFTSTDGNQLARQMTKLFEMAEEDPFVELRSPVCNQELSAIAANWPRTVAGYDKMDITSTESSLSYRVVFESKNQIMLDAYQQMRGYIPAYVQDIDNSVATLGLGIDINQMVPSLQAIWDEMLTPEYQCAPLQEMQAQMSQQSPAMLGMVTGMANGVKGVGLSVIDYKINDDVDSPEIESLDAVMTLSAENPAMLFNMVKPFAPELANIQLPTDGSAIVLNDVLPMPPEMKVTAKLAVKGNHLVLFFGDKGEAVANTLSSEPIASNGLLAMSADYMKMFAPLLKFIELTGEPVPEEFKAMKDYDMRVKVELDVDDKGIIIDSTVNSRAGK
ncbi:hypothetical protein L2755_08235 [Shewanella abyssi]|uniref:hypothetical protein n=1 Tax=Shewanella abyssi TaxID=311789 RepID=UPI00200DFADD|nr:hypothetical protein [Shewanella abyssi]MCL1049604.1 hypothetical protein [Shewanella abyssi]